MSAKLTPSILQAGFGLLLLFSNLPALEVEKIYNEALIRNYAQHYGVDEELAVGIGKCESDLLTNAKNPRSSAESIFQFLDSTWKDTMIKMGYPTSTSKFNDPLRAEAGIWLLKNEGEKHWEQSRNCWRSQWLE